MGNQLDIEQSNSSKDCLSTGPNASFELGSVSGFSICPWIPNVVVLLHCATLLNYFYQLCSTIDAPTHSFVCWATQPVGITMLCGIFWLCLMMLLIFLNRKLYKFSWFFEITVFFVLTKVLMYKVSYCMCWYHLRCVVNMS